MAIRGWTLVFDYWLKRSCSTANWATPVRFRIGRLSLYVSGDALQEPRRYSHFSETL